MCLRYSNLVGNTPSSVLKWLQKKEQFILVNNALTVPDFLDQSMAASFRDKLKSDLIHAQDICKHYRSSLTIAVDVAFNRYPIIAITSKSDHLFTVELIISNNIEDSIDVNSLESAYNYVRLIQQKHCKAFIADASHVGGWLTTLSIDKRLSVLQNIILGDFGQNYFSPTLNIVERMRIDNNQLIGPKSQDYFIDRNSNTKIYDPYYLTEAPASRYGWSYIKWFLNLRND